MGEGDLLRRSIGRIWMALMLALPALPGNACPICETDTGQQVRQGIFDGSFGWNVFVTLLPFPILLGVVLAIYFGIPRPVRLMGRRSDARITAGPEEARRPRL